jgi:cyclase
MTLTPSDRRDFLRTLLTGAAGLTLAHPVSARAVFAQAPGRGPAPLSVTKLTDRIAVVGGAGGNIGVVLGPDGAMMIDGGLANRAADVAQTITSLTPRMVQVLFNTHYHGDHVGSNEFLGKNKVRIIAHANVRTRLGMTFESAAFGNTIQALSAVGQPTETFTAGGKLAFGQEALTYTHTPLAHTDGDAFVFFPNANIIHTGDLLFVGRYPVVDFTAGGSLAGMAGALEQMDSVGDANTRIIPGHGPASVTKAQMRQAREMWLTINQRLEQLAQQGRTVDEAIAAAPTKDFDMSLNIPAAQAQGFLRQAYGGVLARRAAR